MPVLTPQMLLPNPTIGTDSGLVWERSINSALTIIDGHNHSSGSGAPINADGISIETDLTFNGNDAIQLRSTRYVAQATPLSDVTDLGCVYVSGVDLYYNDINGNQVQLTAGGSVNATSSGISDGTASAAFVSSVLVVDSNTNTPANIKAGSFLLGNNSAGSHYLTLSPPGAMAADYTLTLPALPASTLFVTLDTSGNFGTAANIQGTQIATGSLVATQLANATLTNTQIANATIRDAKLTILKPVNSGVISSFTTSSTIATPTGLTRSITTTGGAVMVTFAGNALRFLTGTTTSYASYATFSLFRDATLVNETVVGIAANAIQVPPAVLNFIDPTVTAASHVYAVSVRVTSGGSESVSVINTYMTVTEL